MTDSTAELIAGARKRMSEWERDNSTPDDVDAALMGEMTDALEAAAAHDAELQARAWFEGADASCIVFRDNGGQGTLVNPYATADSPRCL